MNIFNPLLAIALQSGRIVTNGLYLRYSCKITISIATMIIQKRLATRVSLQGVSQFIPIFIWLHHYYILLKRN